MFTATASNLLSPVVLCFLLGCAATLVKSDLKIPDSAYSFMTIYLLFALGLKGGTELAHTELSVLLWPAVATIALGIVTPIFAFFVARSLGKLSVADSAALAAHYGSVSVVTFISAQSFLDATGENYEGFTSTLVVLLESPAIIVALCLARLFAAQEAAEQRLADNSSHPSSIKKVLQEILTSKSIFLMLGGLIVGWISGGEGYKKVEPLFGGLFQGIVALFLLEMGMVASRRFRDFRKAGPFVVLFGVTLPIVCGALGAVAGHLAGLSLGGTTILATLAASASYIAAPAAVRMGLPSATPGIYLTASLAVTFPFNILFGIPLYFKFAQYVRSFSL